jgi:predicted Zn finger-like uncharacterized protein
LKPRLLPFSIAGASLCCGALMAEQAHEDFTCPSCQARYKVVRVKAEPGRRYKEVHCRVCHAVLTPTDGDNILKYFLVRRPPKA